MEGGFLRIAVLPTALLWLMQAHAAMNAYACNDCTQAQYREKAASVVAEYGTTLRPYAYIYDKTRGVLRKYSVSPKAVAGGYQYVLDDIAPTASESDIWNEIREAIAANGGKSIFRVELDAANDPGIPDRGSSISDFARTSAFRNDISDWLTSGADAPPVAPTHLTTAVLVQLSRVASLHDDPLSIEASIRTVDHGLLKLLWTSSETHFVAVSASDANGGDVSIAGSATTEQR
ncbi:MAG TPA: hypothetical protein VHC92_12370 [Rhodanobacteraceae bacterium]|nr:hypothetical protein [Rhodanobacteraceae bacterium]